VAEWWRERQGGHPCEASHRPHLESTIGWLERAQDATPDRGFARGYGLAWSRWFRRQGWQPSYPETTGYIIPTFYQAAHHLSRPDLAERATAAAQWEIEVQLPSGAVPGGVIGEPVAPAVFNTGQVIFGWLAAHAVTGRTEFADAARRAGRYLVDMLEADGHWRTGNSLYARPDTTLYNARVAWALAEAGRALDEPSFVDAAARNLRAVAALQHANGWLPHCCLNDPERPLLHTLAYATRGLLEGGRVLEDDRLVDSARRIAEALAERVRPDGWMAGRFDANWSAAVRWSCLTGQAQMANNWIRFSLITGETHWLEPLPSVLRFLKGTQNRTSQNPALCGGIKGSYPIDGDYGRFELLNWAAKFFADALIRHERVLSGAAGDPAGGGHLA